MAKIRETEIDADGNVVERRSYDERPRKKGGIGGFVIGIVLGMALIVGGVVLFAEQQGSYQTAGREADQAVEVAEQEISETASDAGAAIDDVQSNVQEASNETPG